MLTKGLADFKKDKISAAEYRKLYDKLNRQVENVIKYADRNCKKGHTGAVPFSPKTKKLQGKVFIWKAVLKYRTQRKKNLRLLKRKMKKWKFDQKWFHLSVIQIRVKIAAARVQYQRYKPQAWEERRSSLGKLAQEYADRDASGKDASHNLQQLQRQESERAAYQRIKYALKPPRSSVTRIENEEDDRSRRMVVDKEEMEKEIGWVNVSFLPILFEPTACPLCAPLTLYTETPTAIIGWTRTSSVKFSFHTFDIIFIFWIIDEIHAFRQIFLQII